MSIRVPSAVAAVWTSPASAAREIAGRPPQRPVDVAVEGDVPDQRDRVVLDAERAALRRGLRRTHRQAEQDRGALAVEQMPAQPPVERQRVARRDPGGEQAPRQIGGVGAVRREDEAVQPQRRDQRRRAVGDQAADLAVVLGAEHLDPGGDCPDWPGQFVGEPLRHQPGERRRHRRSIPVATAAAANSPSATAVMRLRRAR